MIGDDDDVGDDVEKDVEKDLGDDVDVDIDDRIVDRVGDHTASLWIKGWLWTLIAQPCHCSNSCDQRFNK